MLASYTGSPLLKINIERPDPVCSGIERPFSNEYANKEKCTVRTYVAIITGKSSTVMASKSRAFPYLANQRQLQL